MPKEITFLEEYSLLKDWESKTKNCTLKFKFKNHTQNKKRNTCNLFFKSW